jgi:cytochrome c oxidase assembly factor CtaG
VDALINIAVESWSPPWTRIALLLLVVIVYVRGFAPLHQQMPDRFPMQRLVFFLGGIATLFIAIASPLEELDDLLLQVHMIQHLLLMIVAPALLLCGAPLIPIVRGLPVSIAKSVVGPISRSQFLRTLFHRLTEPLVCWFAFALATWGWHTPPAFQLALRSPVAHAIEHACFFGTALMFWWPVIQPWPSVARWPRWTIVPYLLFADLQNTALAAILTFEGRLLYPMYAAAPRVAGISPLDDQVMAGVIMWVPASLFYLVPGAVILMRYLSPRGMILPPRVGSRRDPELKLAART